MPELSAADRDLMARTIIGEADDQPPVGQAAVAHVIMNRLKSGRYGETPSHVVLARGQFEPWSTRARELSAIKPEEQRYRHAAAIVDGVARGQIPDPTGGATHFLDPGVMARRGKRLPDWASGDAVRIGAHAFYKPADEGGAGNGVAAINRAIGAPEGLPPQAAAYSGDDRSGGAQPSIFESAGFRLPKAAAPSAAEQDSPQSIFEAAGFRLPKAEAAATNAPPAAAPAGARDFVQAPGAPPVYVDAAGKPITPSDANTTPERSFFERAHDAASIPAIAARVGPEVAHEIGQSFRSSTASMSEGVSDILHGRSATGVGKAALGALGAVASPITGSINALVEQPITQLTGNPEAGSRAGLIAGLVLPSQKGARIAREALPSSRAVNALVDAIGPENVPGAVERMRANPQLSPVDVSDPVRTMTQGLIDPGQPRAQNIVSQAVRRRIDEGPAIVNSAYTESMGPAPNVMTMVEGLKQRAREVGRKEIDPALAAAKPVDVAPVIAAIDKELKPGLQALADPGTRLPLSDLQQELVRLRAQLTDGRSVRVDARQLHDIQSRMGDQAYQLSMSPNPKDRMLGSQLRGFNEKLIDQIDEASGGAYRPARSKFADAKDIHEAFNEGFDVLKNRSGVAGLEDRPEALRQWMQTATPEQVVAKRIGVRADIDQKIRGVRNQVLAGTNITKIEYNREKLESLFGKQEASRLVRAMDDAADVAATNAKLIAGSKTAETLAGQRALEVPKIGGTNQLSYLPPVLAELMGQSAGIPVVGAATALGLKGAHMGMQKLAQVNALARNTAFARAATASGPERDALLDRLVAHPKVVRRQLQKPRNALTSALRP